MKIRIWGTRGSIPSPLKPKTIRDKIRYAILNMPQINAKDSATVDAYLDQLPALVTGTAGGNTTCVEIQAGSETFIIDAGSGLRELGLELMKGPCSKGEGKLHFFFTHAHWDHIQGFPFFAPGFVPGNKIYIHSIHNIHEALEQQQNPVNFPIALSTMAADIEFIEITEGVPFVVGDVTINTLKTVHPGDAYAYRFEDTYGTFVFASDAEYKDLHEASLRPFLDFYQDADVLIFDAQYTLKEGLQREDWGHSSAMIGADIARSAGVKKLVLFHHDPTYTDEDLLEIQRTATAYQAQESVLPSCEIEIAYEGMTFDLTPAGTIQVRRYAAEEGVALTPAGNFDELAVSGLEKQLARFEETGWPSRLVIDLSQADSLTTSGLKLLVMLRKEQVDTAIALAGLSPGVQQVLELAGFLDYFAIYPTVEAALEALQASETANLPGQLIKERYRIESRLGETWQGVIFKATDTWSNDPVAVTALSPSFGERAIDRFLHQTRQLLNLSHPNIAQILECDQEQGFSYIIEEFIEGKSLRSVLQHNPDSLLAADLAWQISLNIVGALEYAHSRGVIHYNLTPRSVLLNNTAKLTNFGLADMTEGRPLLDGPLFLLEAPYLAPEQIQGQSPDARTDLYALGVIIYELFTGQPPFTGPDHEVMQAHLYQSPVPPRKLNAKISRSLDHFILKLLSKNPEERYATAHQVRQILDNLNVSDETNSGLSGLQYMASKPLVNRDEELQRLESLWDEVQRTETPCLVALQGEMGIGKSRLAAEFLIDRLLPQNVTVVVGHCDEFGTPYTPYAEILATLFNEGLVDERPSGGGALSAEQAIHLTRQIPSLIPVLDVQQEVVANSALTNSRRAQWQFFETIQSLLLQLGPVVILLEDASFLDEASQALTRFLIRRVRLPLLIIAAGRDDEGETPWYNAFQGERKETIILSPLPAPEIKVYLTNIMGGVVGDSIVSTVERRSRGNPYFIEEITGHLIARSTFFQDDEGVWHYQSDGGTGLLPQTLVDVFSQRVERLAESRQLEDLTDSARQALAVAAAIGQEFEVETWTTVLGGDDPESLALDTLDEALGLRLLRQAGGNRYAFDPVDIADALISALDGDERQRLHLRIAEVLARIGETPAVISQHYEEAGQPARAAEFLAQAAEKARSAFAINEAIAYYVQAEALSPSQAGYEALGDLYRQQGQAAESVRVFRQALLLAKKNNDVEGQARILNGLALIAWLSDKYEVSSQAAADVLKLPDVSPAERAAAQSHLGMIAWVAGRLEEAESWCRQALETLTDEAGMPRVEESRLAGVLNRLGLVYLARSQFEDARAVFNKSLEIRRIDEDYWGQAYCLNNLGKVSTEEGDFSQALIDLMAAQEIFEEIDSPDGLMVVYTNQGRVLLRQGRGQKSIHILLKALDQAKKLSAPNAAFLGDIYLLIAQASLQLRDRVHAKSAVEEALVIVKAAGNQEYMARGQAILAHLSALEGDVEAAEAGFKQSLALFERVGSLAGVIRTRLLFACFLAREDEQEKAEALKTLARREADRLGLFLGADFPAIF